MLENNPTPEMLELAEARARSINDAEQQAWAALAIAVDANRPAPSRRDHAALASNLFTCIAAVAGQPVQVINPPQPTTTESKTDDQNDRKPAG